MKTLTLYVDKWYIIGAVCTDGVPHSIELPNREDRVWLYFYEDCSHDSVVYGRGNMPHYRNNENHYYGDIFSLITDPRVSFTRYQRKVDIKNIFEVSGIFNHVKKMIDQENGIETFVSFSVDIAVSSQQAFLNILKEQGFVVKQSVARIDHLALEYACQKNKFIENGRYLVLNACNENLHYSIYNRTPEIFVREHEDQMPGMGKDMRCRALLEAVVDTVNNRLHFLSTREEKEKEYLRLEQNLDQWLLCLNNANPHIPFAIRDVSFANSQFVKTNVSLKKKDIDDRTVVIVNDIVREITNFVKDSDVPFEDLKGMLFLGNTFTNSQFKQSICEQLLIPSNNLVFYKDSDLANIVGVYSVIDCEQFSADSKAFVKDAEAERKRKENAILEEENRKQAEDERAKNEEAERLAHENDNKYREAMEQVFGFEKKEDYAQMKDWCEIALQHKPNDEQAKTKLEDAQRLLSEEKVKSEQYNIIIKRARKSLEDGLYQDALSQSDSALNVRPDSKEAQRIHEEALMAIERLQKIKDFITRADIFVAQKLYKEALSELDKALSLDDKNELTLSKSDEIQQLKGNADAVVQSLITKLKEARESHNYDLAIEICEKLIDSDSYNVRKWSETIQQIRNQKEDRARTIRHLKQLEDEIDDAKWQDDWQTVISLCRQYLTIEDDEKIEQVKQQAENKLAAVREKEENDRRIKEFEQSVESIKALIADEKWSKANAAISDLSKQFPEEKDVIRTLRKRVFDGENSEPEQNSVTSGRPIGFKKEDKFFDEPVVAKKSSAGRKDTAPKRPNPNTDDDFFNDSPTVKKPQKPSEKKIDGDDFFNDSNSNVIVSRNKQITNDDFNF